MVSSYISKALEEAGLARYAANFANLTDEKFLGLIMADYQSYGVSDLEEKQKLFRLIKQISANRPTDAAAKAAALSQLELDHNNGLIDLDEHDGDLLGNGGNAFQLSPLANQKQPAGKAAAASAAALPPMPNEDPPKIRVVVRKRPINRKERERGEEDIVDVKMSAAYAVVNETKLKVDLTKYLEKHQFNFDEVLDESVTNDQVYRFTVMPLVSTLFRNGRASCFAYGQTGSGKTYTMGPLPTRAAADIFMYMARPEFKSISLHVSCFEIYGNKLFDLLNQRKKLAILEDGKKKVVVVGLKEHVVDNVEQVKQLIEESSTYRSTGSTAANADSSRSHSIFQFALKKHMSSGEAKLVGKISFIDLAGSERGADTNDNNRQTRLEGAEINKSLLALKECIRALDSDARHVPFRGSKLTAVLRDSFIGDQARTVMIANISPNNTSVEHTLNTLRYADRVKELRKEKVDRLPGGVTPGDDKYYAAVARAGEPPRDAPRAVEREKEYTPPPARAGAGAGVRPKSPLKKEEEQPGDELALRRDELLDSILLEEESLVTFHRAKLEEDMEMMRREMALLQDVDQPGSEIDSYVEEMTKLLELKRQGIEELQAKLDAFKQKLKEEDILSKTVHKQRGQRF